jgi:HSP20 family protein
MNLIPRSAFDFDHLLDFGRYMQPFSSADSSFVPRVDVKENKDRLEITAELPGVKKEDVEVTLENGVLTITAESRQEDKEEKDGRIIRQERRYGKYIRSFDIGMGIEEKDIQARFNDGILTVTAPRQQKQREARKIGIN